MAVTAYCTTTQLTQLWSSFGMTVRLDDNEDGLADSGVADAMIEKATTTVNRYLLQRYTVAVCAASAWVKWATAFIAACDLARRRGNPVPEAMEEECQRYLDALQNILDGKENLITDDGVAPPELDNTPTVSNMTIDGRFRRAKVRRVETTSTGGSQSADRLQSNTNDHQWPHW